MTPAICPDRGGGPSVPLPSPSEAFFIPTGQPLFQASLQAGFPLFGVIVHWQESLLQLWWGIVLFSGDGWRQLKVMTRNGPGRHMETWTGGSPAFLPACLVACSGPAACALLFICTGRRPLPLSRLHRRLYSPSIRRVQSPPVQILDTGARSPVLRRKTALHLPAGRGVVPFAIKHRRPNQINLSRQTISHSSSPNDDPQPSTLRPVTFQLSPGASNQIETPPQVAQRAGCAARARRRNWRRRDWRTGASH